MKNLILLFVAVVMVGCGSPSVAKLVKKNNANMAKLSVGMNKSQVVAIMGVPEKSEAYETKEGGSIEYLFYRSLASGGLIDNGDGDKFWTPVCVIDGLVKGWGRNFYDDTIKIRKEIIRD